MLQSKRAKQAAHSACKAKRVGGGYEILDAHSDAAQAADAATSMGRLLQGLEGPFSEEDLLIIKQILSTAEKEAISDAQQGHGGQVTLSRLLHAYESVLPQHGLLPAEDLHYYHILLKLALDPDQDWWERFHREQKQWNRQVCCVKLAQ